MKLYDTQTRSLATVEPHDVDPIGLYTCGPTVYLEPHIGNWRTFIMYDTLARTLRAAGYDVTHVLNLTDVGHLVSDNDTGEDKLALQAQKERKTAWEVAESYIRSFNTGLERLGFDQENLETPRATDHIAEQIELIKRLESNDATYTISDGVYFDTSKAADYGRLAGFKRDQQQAGARVEVNPEKRHPADFALWKLSPSDAQRDMEWDSPWGRGFPGWHLECSAMAMRYLGETIDIHAGGIDHIGVHHTNEIAQSETATGKSFSRIWVHANFMLVDGGKMSKSLGNVYTLDDLVAKGFTPAAFRLLCLQAHYRSELNFTWESLTAAQNFLIRLQGFADLKHQSFTSNGAGEKPFQLSVAGIQSALENDLDSPVALAKLSAIIDSVEAKLSNIDRVMLEDFLLALDAVLGLNLANRSPLSEAELELVSRRQAAREQRDWDASDELRIQLASAQIEVNDTPYGPRWRRTRP